MSTTPTPAVIYVRQSLDRDGQGLAIDRQREDCERRARERGWTVVAVHVDNDTSASTGRKRPGFEAMLADLQAGRARVVIAWNLDRITRNRADTVRLIESAQAANATIALVRGTDLDMTTPAGRMTADILAAVARNEIEQKSDRHRRANAQAARQGRRVGGRRPFGYELDGVTARDAEFRAVRDGYEAVLAGVPLAAIAREWNARGFTTGQGKRGQKFTEGQPGNPWRPDSVRTVLLNPRYCGKRALNGDIITDAVWPAPVTEDTWEAVRATLTDPARRSAPTGGARALLTGIARCGVCGATVHAGGSNRPGDRMYRCSATLGHVGRRARPVDEYVGDVIVARLSRPDAAELLVDDDRPDVDALRVEAHALRARLTDAAAMFADGIITREQLRTTTERARGRLEDIDTAMADAGRVNILAPLVGADDVQAAWDGLDVDRQRAVVALLVDVVVHPAGKGTRNPEKLRATVKITPKR